MGDISLVEWIVYGSIAYSSVIFLISMVAKPEIPSTKSYGAMRIVFMIPGLICAGVLVSSGVNIDLPTNTLVSTTKDLNSSTVWSQSTTQTTKNVLMNPVWTTVHLMFFLTLLIYIITQVLFIFTKHD